MLLWRLSFPHRYIQEGPFVFFCHPDTISRTVKYLLNFLYQKFRRGLDVRYYLLLIFLIMCVDVNNSGCEGITYDSPISGGFTDFCRRVGP